ncbi:hypothetical protein J2S21_003896 [Peribacillus cavernae]|nr:hypothetical protein [Peribacillus cavernae]
MYALTNLKWYLIFLVRTFKYIPNPKSIRIHLNKSVKSENFFCRSFLASIALSIVTAKNREVAEGLDRAIKSKSGLITVPIVTNPPPVVPSFNKTMTSAV